MQSSAHADLYRQLQDVTALAKSALAENEIEKLTDILQMHRNVMRQIRLAGDCNDPGLLGLISDLLNTIRDVKTEMEEKRFVLLDALRVAKNKRKIARAYGQ